MRWSLLLLSISVYACEIDEFNDPLPITQACDTDTLGDANRVEGVSFDRDRMICVGIEMAPRDFSALARQSRLGGTTDTEIFKHMVGWYLSGCSEASRNLFTYFEADLEVGGIQISRAGIRKKGFLGSVIGNGRKKPSLKIKMDKYVDDQLLGDTERLTLNNNNQDPTRLNTCLAYELFAQAGYPAPRCNLANVMLGETSLGVYSHVEPIKKRFLRRVFGDDSGSLYEGTMADFTDAHLVGARVGELGHWEAKTGDSDTQGGPLLAVTEALQAPDSEVLSALESVVNLDRFITFWALETLIEHTDGYTAGANNFYVYFDESDGGRATFIPWGADAVMSEEAAKDQERAPGSFGAFVRGELARRLSRLPEVSMRYQVELRRLLDEVWDEEALLKRVDTYAQLVRSAETSETYEANLDVLRAWISARRSQVEEGLTREIARGHEEHQICEEGAPGFMIDLVSRFGFAW